MSSPEVSVIIPLLDAQRSRRAGSKAMQLSRLMDARFEVPRGFVISADAYRSHLWASGARNIASSAVDAVDRERIRTAILTSDIPVDIWDSIVQAYERLSWQLGVTDPKVAVRSSSLEEDASGADFAGAYESYLNVSGLASLRSAVRQVWASLWSGKAAAYRARFGGSVEPAMAVIVQQMISAELSGSALTINGITGDPQKVYVNCNCGGTASVGGFAQYTVDLKEMSICERSEQGGVILSDDMLRLIAEKAILVENVISGRVEVEWVYDGDRIRVLQARSIVDAIPFFPAVQEADSADKWLRDAVDPVSPLSRSLLWRDPRGRLARVPDTKGIVKLQLFNGYVYSLLDYGDEKLADFSRKDLQRWMLDGTDLLAMWRTEVCPEIRAWCSSVGNLTLKDQSSAALIDLLMDAARSALRCSDWMELVNYYSVELPKRLRSAVADRPDGVSLLQRLLGGLRDCVLERDAELQDMGERFAIAEASGKLTDGDWWNGYKQSVREFAHRYGYGFRSSSDMCDIAGWKSWMEDTDPIFRMIGAIARRDKRPSLLVLQAAAERDAVAAIDELTGKLPRAKRGCLKQLIDLTRGWLVTRSDIEYVCALSMTMLRLVLSEFGRRLTAEALLAAREDIFLLSLDELLNLPIDLDTDLCISLKELIADRKHDLWLESRLSPPRNLPILPPGDEPNPELEENRLVGSPAGSGLASGHVRIAENPAQAGSIEPGDVFVVREPSMVWTPFLALAGGLIMERGDEFCHEAITARDYGIPVVVQCNGAFDALHDGQKVIVNGFDGTVEIGVQVDSQ